MILEVNTVFNPKKFTLEELIFKRDQNICLKKNEKWEIL